jgi:hypothetical protein
VLISYRENCREGTGTKTVHVKKYFTCSGSLIRHCTGQKAAFGLPSNSDLYLSYDKVILVARAVRVSKRRQSGETLF